MGNGILEYINGRSCALLGLGVSNLPLAELLCRNGIKLYIYDRKAPRELGDAAERLERMGAQYSVCDKSFEGLCGDVLFRSPSIRSDVSGIKQAVARGAELTSEIELFLKLTPARTYAVTGSDGKTTSTTLTGRFLSAALAEKGARAYVGGNIGTPLLDKCSEMRPSDAAVLELSSFQLMTLSDAPERAAITNISPNHLDWHTDMDEYIEAKKNVIGERTRRLVTNAECETTLRLAHEYAETARDGRELFLFSSKKSSYAEVYASFSELCVKAYAVYVRKDVIYVSDGTTETEVLPCEAIKIPGRHNVENYMTAIALTFGDVPTDVYVREAQSFYGVEHRLELVRTLGGVDYYNSSIDSSPTRTAAALSAMSDRHVVLICGGYDKKIPYAPLAAAICEHGGVRGTVLTGATGEKIRAEIEEYRQKSGKGVDMILEYRQSFDSAFQLARSLAKEGDAVLLSPASASFDAFKNFAERGNTFKRLVRELPEK